MKHTKLIAILMAVMMLVGMLGVNAYADEAVYEETNPYVIYYTNASKEYYMGTYPTPYKVGLTYSVVSDDPYSDWVGAIAMYDTTAETDQLMTVYCVDQYTGVKNKTYYERRNLEDSTFFSDEAAGQLRSILTKGFPNVGFEALGAAAGVEGLTYGEATLATQLAIWKTSYGDDLTINDTLQFIPREEVRQYHSMYLADYYYCMNEDLCEEEYNAYLAMTDEEKAAAEQRVVDVFDYLMALEPSAPSSTVVSAESFVDWGVQVSEPDAAGNCTITATATVDVDLAAGDNMTLTAIAGDYTASTALSDGENDYALTIENVPADAVGEYTLAIDGAQTASDVFLFAPGGNRNTAQSMIGLATNQQLPVHAEVSASDRIVTIHKTDSTEDRNGLENITFDFYYVCSVDEYVNSDVILGTGIVTIGDKDYFSSPTADDIAKYVTGKTPVVSVTTDANGNAVHNFGTDNDGIYLVVERPNPAIEAIANPFFIAIPGGAEAGSDLCKIDVQPKNTVKGEDILIEKDVTKIDNEHDTYDVGENHTWIIQSSIPEGIGTGLKYEVSDTLDERLTLVSVDRVAIAADAGSFGNSEDLSYTKDENETPAFGEAEIVLTDAHYTVTVADDNSGFVMTLTPAGMAYVAEQVGANYDNYEIRTYFTAYINNKAGLGENIPNQAHVDYTNNVGTDYEADSDKPEVHTGGLKLIKTDAANGNLLSGATFTLNVKNEDGTYTPVKFYSDAAMTTQVSEVTTDGNGEAIFYGVAYGTYYLIETSAPEGYNLLTEPVEVTINEASHLAENNVKVLNSAKFKLPETGGIGTLIFTLGGSSLFAAAGALLIDTKKKYR